MIMDLIDCEEMDESTLVKYLELVHSYTGITMSLAKKTLLQGRLRPRIKKLSLQSYSSYLSLVMNSKEERSEFINLVTTHETSFFRTQRVWDYFYNDFLPDWYSSNSDKTLNIWSAAASTGEEVYSVAICCEEFRLKNPQFSYQIIGSDISGEVISIAELAEYSGRSIENFKTNNPSVFSRYLLASGQKFKVKESLKTRIRFTTQNLYDHPIHDNFYDIVFLRNVLIYFNQKDQAKVLSNIEKSIIRKGILVIGESESLNGLGSAFEFKFPLIYANTGKLK